jgi:nucleoside-diphosphate-sugar epimerase
LAQQSHHILLTGCAGFIGSHLCELLLAEGHRVVGIDNFDSFYDRKVKENNLKSYAAHPSFRFVEADIRQNTSLEQLDEDIDTVIHLAAKAGVLPSLKNAEDYIQTNITGTNHLLEWMRARNIKKLLFASSSSVYGNNTKIPFSETDLVDGPISPYAFTKRSCELMNYSYHHLYHIDVLNLRLFTVYGPRQRPDLAIHKFVKLIDGGQAISMFGDGTTARDYTFVGDTVQGFAKAFKYIHSKSGVFEIINLGNNSPVQLKDLIAAIGTAMGKEPKINHLPMQPGDVHITYADIEKASKLLGYNPNTSLQDGLKHFIEWYERQKS